MSKLPETHYFFKTMKSPVGELRLVAGDNGLAAILWQDDSSRHVPMRGGTQLDTHPVLLAAERELREYFEGRRTAFTVKLDSAGTDFQRDVWAALLTIPFGETRSYADIARQIGNPAAVRAVGAATGKNPVAIIAPCHRVIGSSGMLTGFAGGLANKQRLLALEMRQ